MHTLNNGHNIVSNADPILRYPGIPYLSTGIMASSPKILAIRFKHTPLVLIYEDIKLHPMQALDLFYLLNFNS